MLLILPLQANESTRQKSTKVRDPALEDHPKVQELRNLSKWSEGHVWSSPEMHGCITGAFKNQIDWLPLNTGSVRPTQAGAGSRKWGQGARPTVSPVHTRSEGMLFRGERRTNRRKDARRAG